MTRDQVEAEFQRWAYKQEDYEWIGHLRHRGEVEEPNRVRMLMKDVERANVAAAEAHQNLPKVQEDIKQQIALTWLNLRRNFANEQGVVASQDGWDDGLFDK